MRVNYRCETKVRAALEKCLSDNSHLRRTETEAERQYSLFKKGAVDSDGNTDDVPLVSVCVQGGPG